MCVGEKRTLVIPSALGYGDRATGDDIPAKSDLRFEVEALSIKEGKPQPNIFNEIDEKGTPDGKLSEEEVAQWFHDEHEREMPEGLFANEDKNKDGYISWDEFGGPRGLFSTKAGTIRCKFLLFAFLLYISLQKLVQVIYWTKVFF